MTAHKKARYVSTLLFLASMTAIITAGLAHNVYPDVAFLTPLFGFVSGAAFVLGIMSMKS